VNCNICGANINPETDFYLEEGIKYICWTCDKVKRIIDYAKTKKITTDLMIQASFAKIYLAGEKTLNLAFSPLVSTLRPEVAKFMHAFDEYLLQIAEDCEEIHQEERRFEHLIWFPKLQDYYQKSKFRGHSGKGVFLWGNAGGVLLTIREEDIFVTLVFDETSLEARGNVHGIFATKDEALTLIRTAIDSFPEMKPDAFGQ
jgi:hypothetical protein